MTNKTLFAFSLVAATALGSTAFAGPHKGHKMTGEMGHMMKMMERMHGQMHGKGGHGSMNGGMGMMGSDMRKMLDANGDGDVTAEEAQEQLQAKLKEYDADGNGSLSISEYETLHSAMIREKMVDRFQHLDADGDGQITSAEVKVPADKMKRMQKMRAKMKSGGGMEQGSKPNTEQDSTTQEN